MTISRNQIQKNARKFSKSWQDISSEKAESQTFWNEFFDVFGVNRRLVGIFEAKVTKASGHQGFIDVFWPGKLLCEQKSRGQDLDKAFSQAVAYLEATAKVDVSQLPRYVIVCDFEYLRLYDLENQGRDQESYTQILVADLADNIHLFNFIHDQVTQIRKADEAANIEAAERMGKLHDQLKAIGYTGHALEVILIRLLFCMFAEDSGIFAKYQFREFIEQKTKPDGSDLAAQLNQLFHVLNQPYEQRLKNLDKDLADFVYINGQLFAEFLPPASFDEDMRLLMLEACATDWTKISPEIFGALFQSVMNPAERRALGAHYTSEDNILKVINSLFMDELRAEFHDIQKTGRGKARTAALDSFHDKLSNLDFLDPACGCGNFLIVAYRELRLLELDVIETLYKKDQLLDVSTIVRCNIGQFHGIEIDEFPVQIARVAMWLVDHQMNMLVSQHYGTNFARIPLKIAADIQHANALEAYWPAVDYIFGNPPFHGKNEQTKAEKDGLLKTFNTSKANNLDFVSAWYEKSSQIMEENPHIKTAFVSTNSICQGEQVPLLWETILHSRNQVINFAHQTFQWKNAASNVAAVHCVIIGFSRYGSSERTLFTYEEIKGIATSQKVENINPYLIAADNIFIESRQKAISECNPIMFGSMPNDGKNNLLLDKVSYDELISKEPVSKKYIRKFLGAREFLYNIDRWCLWLVDLKPEDLKAMPLVKARIEAVKNFRLASARQATKKLAEQPRLFGEIRQSSSTYLLVPRHSKEGRKYIPLGFFGPEVICGDANLMVQNATLYDFGILTSLMHNSWVRIVCGRIKSDYRYSASIVYNNFPWPVNPTDKQKSAIEAAAQAVLNARAKYPDSSLADLYDPLLMPADLLKAHKAVDKAVDAAYGRTKFATEAERVAFLFELYEQLAGES